MQLCPGFSSEAYLMNLCIKAFALVKARCQAFLADQLVETFSPPAKPSPEQLASAASCNEAVAKAKAAFSAASEVPNEPVSDRDETGAAGVVHWSRTDSFLSLLFCVLRKSNGKQLARSLSAIPKVFRRGSRVSRL